jgi:Hypervirulence associated proteins TUDOR domain
VTEIKEHGELVIESKGKQVKKNASPQNPAVKIERSGNPVVKRASELNEVGKLGDGGKKDSQKI